MSDYGMFSMTNSEFQSADRGNGDESQHLRQEATAWKAGGNGYTMKCGDCRKQITVAGRCYDCAQKRDPRLPLRTIQPAQFRFKYQATLKHKPLLRDKA